MGQQVSSRQLRSAVGDTHWQAHQNRLAQRRIEREEARKASHGLRDYVSLLKIADLHEAHQHSSGRSNTGYRKLNVQADSKYERALERLDELLESDPTLARHLDRAHDWKDTRTGGLNGADKHFVPRIRYHRKWVYGKAVHRPFPTITELKRQALEEALEAKASDSVDCDTDVSNPSQELQRLSQLRKLVRR